MSGLTAPTGGESTRIENVELIPIGFQLCTLFALLDVGTQDTNFGLKHRVRLIFEFPMHYRKFYEDSDPSPACIYVMENLSMNEKANLRKKYVQPMIARVLTDDEAEKFDISSLLGKHFVANISHSSDGKYANIESITPLTAQNMLMFGLQQPHVQQVNPTQFFALSQGFESANFANIKGKARELIMSSEEGKKHKAMGGKFAEPANNNNTATATAPPSGGLIMTPMATTTYEAYIKAGWTDDLLIQHGYARKNEPAPAPAPIAAVAPPVQGPSIAAAPVPQAATVQTPPVAEKKLVFKDPNAQPLEAWIKGGWTVEMIVAQGHASFQ